MIFVVVQTAPPRHVYIIFFSRFFSFLKPSLFKFLGVGLKVILEGVDGLVLSLRLGWRVGWRWKVLGGGKRRVGLGGRRLGFIWRWGKGWGVLELGGWNCTIW